MKRPDNQSQNLQAIIVTLIKKLKKVKIDNAMNKIFYLPLLLIAFYFCQPINAADDKELLELYKENKQLRDELADRDSKIATLEHEIQELKDFPATDPQVSPALITDDTYLRGLEAEVARLRADSVEMRQAIQRMNADGVAAMAMKDKEAASRIASLLEKHHEDSVVIAAQKEELSRLAMFRKEFLATLVADVDREWLDKPYSQIDIAELVYEISKYDEFAGEDQRIAEAAQKLKGLRDNLTVYNEALNLINSPFNGPRVKALVPELNDIRDKASNPDQRNELRKTYVTLDNYEYSVQIFQNLIREINSNISGLTSRNGALMLIFGIIDEKKDEIEQIKSVPWLADEYELYYRNLEQDCLAPNAAAEEILAIKTGL